MQTANISAGWMQTIYPFRERLQWQKEYLEKCNVDLIGGITQVIDEEEKVIYSIKKIPANPDK